MEWTYARPWLASGARLIVGVLFLIGEYTRFSFLELWPILLIVVGVVLTAQSLASKEGHLGS